MPWWHCPRRWRSELRDPRRQRRRRCYQGMSSQLAGWNLTGDAVGERQCACDDDYDDCDRTWSLSGP